MFYENMLFFLKLEGKFQGAISITSLTYLPNNIMLLKNTGPLSEYYSKQSKANSIQLQILIQRISSKFMLITGSKRFLKTLREAGLLRAVTVNKVPEQGAVWVLLPAEWLPSSAEITSNERSLISTYGAQLIIYGLEIYKMRKYAFLNFKNGEGIEWLSLELRGGQKLCNK